MIDLLVIYQVIGNVQKVIWHVRLVYSSSPGIVSPSPIVSPVATESSAVLWACSTSRRRRTSCVIMSVNSLSSRRRILEYDKSYRHANLI